MTLPAPVLHLDPSKAEAADAGGRISTTGDYVGTFTQVKWKSSDSGAAGYVLDFESNAGQVTQGLFICTIKRDGTVNDIGDKQMSALLCCLGLRTINPIQAMITDDVYNEQTQRYEEQQVNAYIYPDACNRPIGLILQKELTSRVSDGQDSYRMQFVRSFQHENRRSAAEMIAAVQASKAGRPIPPAVIIGRTLESIEDKDSRNKEAISHYAGGQPNGLQHNGAPLQPPMNPNPNSVAGGGFDDDIPFMRMPSYP